MKHQWLSKSLKMKAAVIGCGMIAAGSVSQFASAHGTITSPMSRVYQCYDEGPSSLDSAACQAAANVMGSSMLYTWNEVSQGAANDNHQAVVSDGMLCSGGADRWAGLDLARTDWVAAPVSAGPTQFGWTLTAPHASAYYDYYITRDGYDATQPLKWSDLQFVYRQAPDAGGIRNVTHTVDLPNRTGKHVVYAVWQRNLQQSPEAFYACVDVDFGNGNGNNNGGSSSSSSSSSVPSSSSSSSTDSGDACDDLSTWSSDAAYGGGDQVEYNGVRYEAEWWTQGDNPEQNSGSWQVWVNLGACSGDTGSESSSSASSVASSTPSSSSVASSSASSVDTGDCGAPAYVNGASYNTGDEVANAGNVYQCAVGGWCSQGGAYEPGVGWAWDDAWDQTGSCN